jgi:hypothetical protein
MAECQTSRYAAFDDELAAMLRSMMRTAEKDHAIGVVVAAFGAEHDVMDVEKQPVLASGNRASTAVTADDCTTRCRACALVGARNGSRRVLTHVGAVRQRSEVLGVAPRHFDDRGVEHDRFTCTILPAIAAVFANGHRNLVAGTARVGWAAEDMARDEEERVVVVGVCARVAADFGDRFAERREGFGGNFEAKNVAA